MTLLDTKMNTTENKKILLLFDVDGTLTPSRNKITEDMNQILEKISVNNNFEIGFVGGSNLEKQKEQLGNSINYFKYWFPENGLVAYKDKQEFYKSNLLDFFTEDKLQEFISFTLKYIADLKIPKKRGTFIEFRNGLINVSPIGRNCNREERDEFEKFDHEHKIRNEMISQLKNNFPDLELTYSIGGQISFDVFPKGWDKTFCLKHLNLNKYSEIHFFGDKCFEGGNDYEIYVDKRVIGHEIKNYTDTIKIIENILKN